MFGDSLTRATNNLLTAIKAFGYAMDEKKRVIEAAQVSINEAQEALNEAKKSLSL